MKKILSTLTLLLLCAVSLHAAPDSTTPDAAQVYAWYRDDGLVSKGGAVSSWKSAGGNPDRALNQIVGKPLAARVQTPGGERPIVSLDGTSALWQKVEQWGEIDGDRTVVVLARLPQTAEGFLFDGSTGKGLSRAQVRAGRWQAGVQSSTASATTVAGKPDTTTQPAKFGAWQTHAFAFHPANGLTVVTHTIDGTAKEVQVGTDAPLSGLIVGANGAAKNGLRAQIAEILVYKRALPASEVANVSAYLQKKWGALTPVATTANGSDLTTLKTKLADRSTPLVWVFSGAEAPSPAQSARGEAEHFAERVRWEMNRRRDIVINTSVAPGSGGALLPSFEARVARFRPSVVVLTPAASDSAPDIAALVSRVRGLDAIPVLQANAANASAVRQVALESGVLLVDGAAAPAEGAVKPLTAALFQTLDINDAKSAVTQFVSTNTNG